MGWRLANRRQPAGALLDAPGFASVVGMGGELRARRVSVPTEVDVQRALENAGGLASDGIRSLEFWWDNPGRRLDVVLVAERGDMPAYEQDFAATYVNATFDDCPVYPEWYDRRYYEEEAALDGGGREAAAAILRGNGRADAPADSADGGGDELGEGEEGSEYAAREHAGLECTVFDVGYRHGHFQAAFDTRTKHDTITQVSSVMQLARYGWLQLVFCKADLTRELQSLAAAMKSKYAEVTESKHQSTSDMLLSTSPEAKMRDHPEKKGDFAAYYQSLQSYLVQKLQDEQAVVSVRGLLESEHKVRLDWSGVSAAQAQGSSLDHLTANEYGYAEFVGLRKRKNKGGGGLFGRRAKAVPAAEPPPPPEPKYRWEPDITLRIDGKKRKHRTRLEIFEHRLLPDVSALRRPVSKYVSKRLLGGYGTRMSPPFILMTLPELGLLLRLPDTDATPNLTITRQQVLPKQPQQAKSGFCLGFFERKTSVGMAAEMPDLDGWDGEPGAPANGRQYEDDGEDVHAEPVPAEATSAGAGAGEWWRGEFGVDGQQAAAGDDIRAAATGGSTGSPAGRASAGDGGDADAWWRGEFDIPDSASAREPAPAADPGSAPAPAPAELGRDDALLPVPVPDPEPDAEQGGQEPGITAPLPDMFGQPGLGASVMQGVVLSPEDLQTHIYITGGTKSGKTTIIRDIGKHLELANLRGTFPNAFIFIDPKGSDSYDFLRQCEPESYDAGNVTFLDPIETKFSINVLELPSYDGPEDRQVVVSQYVGYIMKMIEYWYHGSDAFVRLKRILDTLLQYVYLSNDKPTFLDVYEIIVSMQQKGEDMLTRMFKELGVPEDVLKQAIQSVANMDKQAYEPALNRLEKFATDPILRHMFCVRESTVRFEDMIKAGSYTIIRMSNLSIPEHIITLTKQTLVIKLWFAIQERANKVKLESERTQVLLALDEFQDLAGLPVIESMLTQARSYGLGLLLAHQSSMQLEDSLFEIILGNAGTQFVGRVSGKDAARFGDAWDPSYSKELKSQLATQEYHHWTARMVAGGGESQPLPVQFWPVYIPPRRRSEQFLSEFIAWQKRKYGSGEVGVSMMREAENKSTKWLDNVPYMPPSRDDWELMCVLKEAGTSLILKKVVERFRGGTTASDTVAGILSEMTKKKLAARDGRKYMLPHDVSDKYLTFDPTAIGTSEDIPLSTDTAVRYYLGRRHFLCVASQKVRKGRYRTDLVAYDYASDASISVEIESSAEVHRHPEHVKLNMTKWRELGFERCHVWSTHPGIRDIYEGLTGEQREGVEVFLVGGGSSGGGDGDGVVSPDQSDPSDPPPPLQKLYGRRQEPDAAGNAGDGSSDVADSN